MADGKTTRANYNSLAVLGGSIEFVRRSNRRLSQAVFVLSIGVVLVAGVAVFALLHQNRPVYFAATPDLRIVELKPLSAPVLTEAGVRNWAVKAITSTLSLSFVNWRKELTSASQFYTPKAFQAVLASLKHSGLITTITKQRLDAVVSLTGAAVITNTYTQGGVLYIRVNIPIVVSYENSRGTVGQQNLLADILVRRVPVTFAPSGIAIEQIVMTASTEALGGA